MFEDFSTLIAAQCCVPWDLTSCFPDGGTPWCIPLSPLRLSLTLFSRQWNNVGIDDLKDKAKTAHTVLGFNEPELHDQSHMTTELAAKEWIRGIEPLRRSGIRCGSPGISSAPQGVEWLQKFLGLIREGGSDIDFYAIHWYGETLGQFYDYIWSTYHRLGPDRPVWITEFAPTNWNADNPLGKEHVENFARESCKYLDTLDWVERYAWFGPMRDAGTVGKWAAMIDNEGRLTVTGKIYRDS